MKKLYKNLFLPYISKLSKFLYKRKLRGLPQQKDIKILLHFIIEKWNKTSELSLKSFFLTNFDDHKASVRIYYKKGDDSNIKIIVEKNLSKKGNFKLIEITNDEKPFVIALKNSVKNSGTYSFHAFLHAEALFHKEWFNQSISLGLKLVHSNNNYKIGAFSTFNPSDYKLLRTIEDSNDFVLKDGFSFLNIFFYDAFLKKYVTKLKLIKCSKDFTDFFHTYDFFAAFSRESYIEGINNFSDITAEDFFPKQNNLSFAQNPKISGWSITENDATSFSFLKLRTLVIQINYGGLGDHLFCTHLPRIAKETGRYDKVYISNHSLFRQQEIKNLIWEPNPYIDGFCDEPGYNIEFLKFDTNIMNILDDIMLLHHLDDGQRFHEPELYFKPEIIKELEGRIIFDPNYISNAGDLIKNEDIRKFFQTRNINIDYQMCKRDKNVYLENMGNDLQSNSLENFINILASCKEIYCFATGTATLSAALGKKAHVFYSEGFSKQFLHSKSNEYIKL
ncbi:MAG: hypothetical protein PHT69_14775 [Bacteroidales bacterium]|nr:hypothetical protein [Bacteroidales bacterium]